MAEPMEGGARMKPETQPTVMEPGELETQQKLRRLKDQATNLEVKVEPEYQRTEAEQKAWRIIVAEARTVES